MDEFLFKNKKISLFSDTDFIICNYNIDKSSYKSSLLKNKSLINILICLGSCYLELWNYSEAEKCFNEALIISDNSDPVVYFKLGQCKLYNKFSNFDDLALVMSFFSKSKRLIEINNNSLSNISNKKNNSMFKSNYIDKKNNLNYKIVENLIKIELFKLANILKQYEINYKLTIDNLLEDVYSNYNLYSNNSEYLKSYLSQMLDTIKKKVMFQTKVLNKMNTNYETAIRYYIETSNNQQIDLTYKELEEFNKVCYEFNSYLDIEIYNVLNIIKKSNRTINSINLDLTYTLIELCKYKFASKLIDNYVFNNDLLIKVLSTIENVDIFYKEYFLKYSESNKNNNLFITNKKEQTLCFKDIVNMFFSNRHFENNHNSTNKNLNSVKIIKNDVFNHIDNNINNCNYSSYNIERKLKSSIAFCNITSSKKKTSNEFSFFLLFIMLMLSFFIVYIQNYFYYIKLNQNIKPYKIIDAVKSRIY